MIEWDKIKTEYVTSYITLDQLASKHGLTASAVKQRSWKEGWRAERKRLHEQMTADAVKKAANARSSRIAKLMRVSDKVIDAIEKSIDSFEAGELDVDKTLLKQLSSAIKDIKDVQGIKTPLDEEEQRARIEKLRKDAQRDDVDREIVVRIDGGAEEWSK